MTFAHAVGGTMSSEHAPLKERARMTSHGDPRGQVADDVIDDSDRCANNELATALCAWATSQLVTSEHITKPYQS